MGGRDDSPYGMLYFPEFVSTHAPVGGRDTAKIVTNERPGKGFNSRARGRARHSNVKVVDIAGVVSTHAPVGGRDGLRSPCPPADNVSTHAPVGGRDTSIDRKLNFSRMFQLTRPWEGATLSSSADNSGPRVSTHAPVGGRDNTWNSETP